MSRAKLLRSLASEPDVIAPSLLKCDYARLEQELRALEDAGTKVLHLDVMDGHFVPNLSYGPMVIESLRKVTEIPFDTHLMISDPKRYLKDYIAAGCDGLTIHIEAVPEPGELLEEIRAAGLVAGLALNPDTPVSRLKEALPLCDYVLVMSVNPGFGGQKFMPVALDKLREIRSAVAADVIVGVDGGIGKSTIAQTAAAGANLFVAGSAVFDAGDYAQALRELEQLARENGLRPLSGVK